MLRARHDDERVIKEKIEALSLVCNAAESPCNQEIDVALAQLTVQTRRISLSLARATNSIFHLKDRELIATAGLVDDRRLDAGDPGPARELVEGEVLQMLRIPHDDVHYDVVTAGHEKSDADLRHPGDIIHELIDRAALVLGQFDHEQRLEPDAERLRIDLGMRSSQHPGIPHSLDPLVRRGWCECNLRRDLFDREPSIVLQQAQNGDIHSV